jgi:hypothetical protein
MIAQYTGTVDVTRDSNGKPKPGGGTSSNASVVSMEPNWLPITRVGSRNVALSFTRSSPPRLLNELGHQLLPNGSGTGIFQASTVSAAIDAGEQSEGAAFAAEYVIAQQLVNAGVANKPVLDGGLGSLVGHDGYVL